MAPLHAFILAGGFATRLWPLTEHRAKPLLPLAGMPMLSHIVQKLSNDIVITISTNAMFEHGFEQWMASCTHPHLTLEIEDATKDDAKKGALGAVAQWAESIGLESDVLILTGDNYFGFSFHDFLAFTKLYPHEACVAAFDIQDTAKASLYGVVECSEGSDLVSQFLEKPLEPKSTLVSTGCAFIPRRLLPFLIDYAKQKPDNIGGLFEGLLKAQEPVHAFRFTQPWFDIGSFDSYMEASVALVGEKVLLHETSSMQNCTCTGTVIVGAGCTLKNCELTNVIVFENCTITQSQLQYCIVDTDCSLQNIALEKQMIRMGTHLVQEA